MAAAPVLEFERPIAELEKQIEELKRLAADQSIDVTREIAPLEQKLGEVRVQIYQNLTPLQRGRRVAVPREELLPVAPECDLDEMRHADRSYSVN